VQSFQVRVPSVAALVTVTLALLFFGLDSSATILGSVRGVVHDEQHRPISGASVVLKSKNSDYSQTVETNPDGEFIFAVVAIGDYSLTVDKSGFASAQQDFTVLSDTNPVLHFQLGIATPTENLTVTAQYDPFNVDTVTPTTMVDRQDIIRTPGADRSNSLAMITEFVPGAYVTHDMLHIRGGHQTTWLIDGVTIPNTNIATNLGPQIDPKDIDYLEALRGSYEAEYGDRTFGIFNIVPRSGFDSNNQGELVMSLGNFWQTNEQVNFAGHTNRFAYYVSANGNRSDLGLQPPIPQIDHDADNGYGAFASFIYNADPKDQFRWAAQWRRDYYQIPYDPDPNSAENQIYNTSGLRDGQHETDGFVDFSWIHTISPDMVLTTSPFLHYNSANYQGSPNDYPVATTSDRASTYAGGQISFNANIPKNNNLQVGLYGFWQHDNEFFGNIFNDGSYQNFSTRASVNGGVVEVFLEDKFRVTKWLTLMAGLRQSHFSAGITENATSPRFGIALQVPRLKWVFRAFYGHYYQPPPLLTVTGPLLDFANNQNLTFGPLHGERDEEYQFGVGIPYRGWTLDMDHFQTRATNFLDHNNVGESNVFFPLTFARALIQAWELSLTSPRLWHRVQGHLTYSNQIAQAAGPITGGLICGNPPAPDCEPPPVYAPVDHDQRNTLNIGLNASLPWQSYASGNVAYGSGFTNGSPNAQYPGAYLPANTTLDLALSKSFGERYSVSVTALNATNQRVLLDNSLTFGGFHWNLPREIYGEFRWRFHF
jgi:outer membrane cobalamin receptor